MGGGTIIEAVAGDIGLGVTIPHEGDIRWESGGGWKGQEESERKQTGGEERPPQPVVVIMVDMVFIARSMPLSVRRGV